MKPRTLPEVEVFIIALRALCKAAVEEGTKDVCSRLVLRTQYLEEEVSMGMSVVNYNIYCKYSSKVAKTIFRFLLRLFVISSFKYITKIKQKVFLTLRLVHVDLHQDCAYGQTHRRATPWYKLMLDVIYLYLYLC